MYNILGLNHQTTYVPPFLQSYHLVGFDGYSSKDVLMRVVAQGLNPETTTLDKVLNLSTPLFLAEYFVSSATLFLVSYGGYVIAVVEFKFVENRHM